MKTKLSLFCAVLPSLAFAGDIEVADSYAFAPTLSSKTGAVFMQIENQSDVPLRLMNVQSDIAKKIEVHDNVMEGDVMKMVHQEAGIEIPAGGCLVLERGGYHVMLMGLNQSLEDEMRFDLTLEFDQAEAIDLEVEVDLDREAHKEADDCVRSKAAMMNETMDHGSDHSH